MLVHVVASQGRPSFTVHLTLATRVLLVFFRCILQILLWVLVTRILFSLNTLFLSVQIVNIIMRIVINYSLELYSKCLWLLSSSIMFKIQVRNICTLSGVRRNFSWGGSFSGIG